MEYRIEHDTLGEVKVPADHMWGAQTQRSSENFKIGARMPEEIIHALAVLKKCTALANLAEGKLSEEKAKVIAEACDEILAGKWNGEFPLVVYQTGSGTQSNMNMNEVVAHIANAKLEAVGSETRIHPNDDVNMSQSSNDTFPTAMHVAAVSVLHRCLCHRAGRRGAGPHQGGCASAHRAPLLPHLCLPVEYHAAGRHVCLCGIRHRRL